MNKRIDCSKETHGTVDIPDFIQNLIEWIKLDENLYNNVFWDPNFEVIDKFLRNHPVYWLFYFWQWLVPPEVKFDLDIIKKVKKLWFLDWLVVRKQKHLEGQNFDKDRLNWIVSFKLSSQNIYLDDLVIKSNESYSQHSFMTILLISQLKINKINITEFVNKCLLKGKIVVYTYKWFKDTYSHLNWKSEVTSKNQIHRLSTIIAYNLILKRLGFDNNWFFDSVEFLGSNNIELHKIEVDWEKIDNIFWYCYVLKKEDIKEVIKTSFDDTVIWAEVLQILWTLNKAPWDSDYYVISQYDFNIVFDIYWKIFKKHLLWLIDTKTAKQLFRKRIEKIYRFSKTRACFDSTKNLENFE